MSPAWQKIKTGSFYGLGFSLAVLGVAFLAFQFFAVRLPNPEEDVLGGKSPHEFSLDERIKLTTAIALAKVEAIDGKPQCRVSELLKLAPDVSFNYKVGSVFSYCKKLMPSGDLIEGEAMLIYFYGNPPDVRMVSFVKTDGETTTGDLSVSELRKLIKSQDGSNASKS
jgi:hypothetical protein